MEREEKWENSEVRFAINKYEDIFSNFDPRPVPLKGFSDDFLSEAKRACLVKNNNMDFIFMVPKEERSVNEEGRIRERLKKYFSKHLHTLQEKRKKLIKTGLSFVSGGILIMLLATFIFFKFRNASFLSSFLTILLEPAGWFMFWEGLSQIVFESKKNDSEIDFHKKMSGASIKFISV